MKKALRRSRWTNRLAWVVWNMQHKKWGAWVDSSVWAYLSSSSADDSIKLGSAFAGNLKVILCAPSETGIHPAIVSGRIGEFVATPNPESEQNWVQYEIEATDVTYITTESFGGIVIRYAKNDVWSNVTMGKYIVYPAVPMKSLTIDMINNWGRSNLIGIRSIDLYGINGNIVTLTLNDFATYGTTWIGSSYFPRNIYITALSKTGPEKGMAWLSYTGHIGSLRISLVLDNAITCTKVVINNYHNSGNSTDVGVRDVILTASTDAITSKKFLEPIANSTVLFNDEVPRHVAVDVVDSYVLYESNEDTPSD